MSLIKVHDGPGLPNLLALLTGIQLVKLADAPRPVYNLAGTLYLSSSGWLLLSVPVALVRGVFAAMNEAGCELPPPRPGGQLEPHISVMTKEEVDLVGGPDKITERGKQFFYTLGGLREVDPDGWSEMSKAYLVLVHSPELQKLRRSYGLSSLPKDGKHQFHVTVAVKRRGVLGRNDVKKQD